MLAKRVIPCLLVVLLAGCGKPEPELQTVAAVDSTPRGVVLALARAAERGDTDRFREVLTKECRDEFERSVTASAREQQQQADAEADFLTAVDERFGPDPDQRLVSLRKKQQEAPWDRWKLVLRQMYGSVEIVYVQLKAAEEATIAVKFNLRFDPEDKESPSSPVERTLDARRENGHWRLVVPFSGNKDLDKEADRRAYHQEYIAAYTRLAEAVRAGRFSTRHEAYNAAHATERLLRRNYMPDLFGNSKPEANQ